MFSRRSSVVRVCAVLITFILVSGAHATTIQLSGTVRLADGVQVAGAMVTITDARGVSKTVYTDEGGRWRLAAAALEAPLGLRVRAGAAYADVVRPVDPATPRYLDIEIARLIDPRAISEQLTASAHAAAVRWESGGARDAFISQCHFCHQIGNKLTRAPRTVEQWQRVLGRMEGYGALLTWQHERDVAHTLSRSFQGQSLDTVQTLAMHPGLPAASLREWSFGGPLNYVHDVEMGRDGKIYGVDMSADRIWILDRDTNVIDYQQMPPNDLPLGGMFAGAVAPLGTFQAHHGPHSIVEGPDDKLYMTNSLAAEIGIFDPDTRTFEFIPTGDDSVYPHTLRFDASGTLWFTLALSNQVGRMDPETREITLVDLPSNGFWRWLSDALLPTILEVASWFGKEDMHVALSHHKASGQGHEVLNLPYGIDVSPVDGSIWYSKLYADYIGRIDPNTLEVREFATPYPAPRRLRFDKRGNLWIPSFDSGVLMKFDTVSEAFVEDYKLPLLADNEYETPYAVAVHPRTQQVWIAANMSDRILRFDPDTETFAAYPSPTRVTFMRDFIFTPDGDVCTSNANLPAGAIEGGRPKLMCLTPDGAMPSEPVLDME